MAESIGDIKITIHSLLVAIEIRRVVYVDDVFAASVAKVQEACDVLQLARIRGSRVFPDDTFEADDEDVVRQRLGQRVMGMERLEILDAYIRLATIQGDGIASPDAQVVPRFQSFFDQDIPMVPLSRGEYLRRRDELLTEVPVDQTLFVFDDDFRREGASGHEGCRLASELVGLLGKRRTYLALLTHTVANEDAEEQRQTEIGQEFTSLADRLIVIAKSRLTAEEKGFAWRLSLALLGNMFDLLVDRLQHAAKFAQNSAEQMLKGLRVDDFERIIFHSSHVEGAWAPETLLRVFDALQEKNVRRQFRGDDGVHQLAEQARQLCLVPTEGVTDATRRRAAELQQIEIYDESPDINGLHLPLELGDIFKAKKQQFVVLGQPCDLMVRAKGLRRGPSFDRRYCVPVAEIARVSTELNDSVVAANEGGELEQNGRSFGNRYCLTVAEIARVKPERVGTGFVPKSSEHELRQFQSDHAQVWCVNLNVTYLVPAWLLDLAAFNSDGRCELCFNHAASPLLIPTWKVRLVELQKRTQSLVGKYRAMIEGTRQQHPDLLKSFLGLPWDVPFSVDIDEVDGGWRLCLGLHRIRRVREPFASSLYTHYGHWLTRPAEPHDLTCLGD